MSASRKSAVPSDASAVSGSTPMPAKVIPFPSPEKKVPKSAPRRPRVLPGTAPAWRDPPSSPPKTEPPKKAKSSTPSADAPGDANDAKTQGQQNLEAHSNFPTAPKSKSTPSSDPGYSDMLRRRLITYRRINELYQEKGVNFEQLMKELLDLIVKATEAQGGSLWICDRNKQVIECRVATGPGSKEITGLAIPFGKGIVGWVVDKNVSSLVEDTERDERFSNKGAKNFSVRSLIATPLSYKGEVIGVIEVVNKTSTPTQSFEDQDKVFLEDICTPAAMHIKTSLTSLHQEALFRKMSTIQKLHESFSSTMDLDKLLGMVLTKAIELLNAEVGSLWLVDDQQEKIECHVAEGPTKSKVLGLKLDSGQGIIGWVVENKRGQIVEDCSKDSRFSSAVDEKINFVTRSMVSAPLLVQGECIGAIQILNKKGEACLFNSEDLDFLALFASSSAMYIKNARLFASEKKAKELSALISISKEISSTLDLDSVLMSIVNLSSSIISYDMACVSKNRPGKSNYEVQAISGRQNLDRASSEVTTLNALHGKILSGGKEIYVAYIDDAAKKPEVPEELKTYLASKSLQSFWAYVLKDDQGELGVFTMESKEKNLIPEAKKELLAILISQCTVALRNAELYTTIPKTGALFGGIRENADKLWTQVKGWPREKQRNVALGIVAGLLSLIFVKVPWNVSANIEVVPITSTHYAQSSGRVQEVLVREGQTVKPGDVLIRLDSADLDIQIKQKESTLQKVVMEMLKLQSENKIAEYKIKEAEKLSLDLEIEMLHKQLENSELKSEILGTVVSEKLEELAGKPVTFGQELVKVARMDRVFVQFEVPEDQVPYVQADQGVKFKVFSHPNTSFSSGLKLLSVAGEGKKLNEADPEKVFIARSEVPNDLTRDDGILRPGMTGRGKIYARWQPLGYFLFHKPLKFLGMNVLF